MAENPLTQTPASFFCVITIKSLQCNDYGVLLPKVV